MDREEVAAAPQTESNGTAGTDSMADRESDVDSLAAGTVYPLPPEPTVRDGTLVTEGKVHRGAKNPLKHLIPGGGTISMALRSVGGLAGVIEYVYALAQEDMRFRRLAVAWNTASALHKKKLPAEDFLAAAELKPDVFIGLLASKAYQMNADVASLMVSLAHPLVAEASITQALTPEGIQDRAMIFKHMKLIPVGTGAPVNVQVNTQVRAEAAAVSGSPLGRFEDRAVSNSRILREEVIDILPEPPGESSVHKEAV